KLLKPDAMTGHWEFTYGEQRVKEVVDNLGYAFLALNIRDTEWQDPVFDAYKMFDKGGVKVAVLGEAFAYTPVANPRWMIPKWTFGIGEDDVRATVAKARKVGKTLLIASGSHGKFLSRLDLDVRGMEVRGFRYKLIPLFADVIAPD